MAEQLIVAGSSTTATLVGAWELRAGSHDTTEHLARGGTYPGALDGFHPIQTDAANGYDPAPKMALINVTGGGDGETIILSGGASAILSVMATDAGTAAVAVGASFTGLTATLQYLSGSSNVTTVMILYN